MMLKKYPAFFVFLLSLLLAANAMAAENLAPDVLIKDISERVLTSLDGQQERLKKDPTYVYNLVERIILPHIDFAKMAKSALGKNWRKTNAAQKKAFVVAFRQLLIRTYSKSLSEYSGQTLIYLPFRAKAGASKVTVKTEIDLNSGFPIPINYSLYIKNGVWMVYDIKIDGLSLVTNYRSSFAKQIRAKGMAALIKKLQDKNVQASK